uniref:Uncharacterized protein n=1 Tax=Rhizophora mucronata TaxID=61149 RepID=A0A2P2QJ71_RHIMU
MTFSLSLFLIFYISMENESASFFKFHCCMYSTKHS